MDVSTVTAYAHREPGKRPEPALKERMRSGVLVPLCIIVALAIMCIVIAAFTSAQRANDVAIERQKALVTKALTYRGEWSLRKLKSVIGSDDALDRTESAELDLVLQRIDLGQKTLTDHNFILVTEASGNLVYSFVNNDLNDSAWLRLAYPGLVPMLAYLRGDSRKAPDNVVWLTRPKQSVDGTSVGGIAFMQNLMGRLVIVAGLVTGSSDGSKPDIINSPTVLALQFVPDAALARIGDRIQLTNLRKAGEKSIPANDYAFDILDERGNSVTRLAWTPHRPGAEVLQSVVPFIAIAIIGFAVLTAFVLRLMRQNAATIAEGEDRLHYLAMHDPLCGLPNRIYFNEKLESTIAQVQDGGPPAAVLYIDLDHFKDVNDTLGHSIGDELIRSVTERLRNTLRDSDLVARLGGDEFAVITTASCDHDTLDTIARRIIATLCAPYVIEGHTLVIGASIGIAIVETNTRDRATDIMRYADMALYRAKNEGRNRACIYDTVMDTDLSRRKQLELDLRAAIRNGQLHVFYQPIVNASGEKIIGVEALARWSHPDHGFISPIEFIPLAEHSGLIIELGEWVLRRACEDGKAWPDLSVAVNVSPVQFRQVDFVEKVERILAETQFDPHRLELELTESTLIGNVEIAESAMLRLKGLGVRLALDDFGTGYSSLQYLRRFPFDKIKIDRSFVHSIEKAADAAAIVHAIVSLGRGLGMKVTAEGVENAEQQLFLRAAGVHFMQGYRFGMPCGAMEIGKNLTKPGAFRIGRDAVAAMAS